ncbi:MAG: amino acid adenylation domain-containing protein, partial [candidate division KSB1 bacterium]|nr:amino acid adenylation domain-containing protein [candidate division KSB1 bacterium]
MDNYADRIAKLSPEKQALLMLRLQQSARSRSERQFIPKRENQDEFPMSYSQERMWFLHQLNPDRPLYNIAGAIRLQGRLNVAALHRSLQEIVRRHEVLRARFIVEQDHPVQKILSELVLQLPIIDLSHLPPVKREAELDRLVREEGKTPFHLSRDPLIRVKLIQLGIQEYVLLLTLHHIISDGWSTQILFRELAICYEAFKSQQTPNLPDLPIQYADFAQWQRRWIAQEQLQSQLDYWKNQLQEMPRVLSLAADHPRPTLPNVDGAHFVFYVPQDLSDKILQLSQKEGTTLFMTLIAAFQVLLYRYSGQEDFGIGTPVANRNRSEIEPLIGCFVNTLVIRANLSENPTFRELLHRVRQVTAAAYSHQDLPFEILVDAIQPDRNISHAPLFQVMFDLQNASKLPLQLADLKFQVHEIDTETAKFDLLVSLAETDRGLKAIFEYNTNLFQATTIERMAAHFQIILSEIVQNPDQRISQLAILTAAEQHKMIIEWNNGVAELPAIPLIHRLFEQQAEQNSDATAVIFQEQHVSYGQLNERANCLAHYLISLGAGPETIVGICIERSIEMVLAMIAVLKTGAAYLPLDPSYPQERLSFILNDANANFVLTSGSIPLPTENADVRIIRLDEDWPNISHFPVHNPNISVEPENLAYVIYTSGSTGQPKGVMISHRAAINLWVALNQQIYSQFGNRKLRLSLNAPIFFDASVQQFLMLLNGHALCIIPPEIRQNPEALVSFIRINQLDGLDCVPSQLKLLIEAGLLSQEALLPSIILPGGEAIDPTTWQTLIEADSVQSFNMYGPTECAVDSLICPIRAAIPKPVIGKPIPNVRVYIIDQFLNLVPIGVPGELCIAGLGLARGYLGRPDLTAEKFIPNPFGAGIDERLYRTGDLARYLPDGTIEFLGRIDHQVKIRGFRIELGEIEAALANHSAIQDAVVMAREDSPGDKRLVAYLIARPEAAVTQRELRSYLMQQLPDYMIPNTYVFLEAFPLNRSGKVDRLSLPIPSPARNASPATLVPPRTLLEQQIADAFCQILHLDQVGVFDNFFELGGDSIKAAVLTNQLQQILDIPLNVRSIFLAPSVAEFAEQVRQLRPDLKEPLQKPQTKPNIVPIEPISRSQKLPLSFGQQRLWFLDQFEPNSALYNMPVALHLKGRLDIPIMELAINEIIRRHEILRTIFVDSDGKAEQVILPRLKLKIPVIDLQHLPPSHQQVEAQRFANQESQIPFNLSTGPLIRAKLFQLRPDEFILVVTLHHIIADGWSIGIMLREITALYEAFLDGEDSPLPDVTIQYADFAYWQRQWLQTALLKDQLEYWGTQLRNCTAMLQLPTDRPRPAYTSFRGDRRFIRIPEELTNQFKQLCQQEQVTQFMGLMAVFQTLLSRYSNQTDICVGTPIANRPRAELEHLIGFFVNTLVIRTNLAHQPSFREVLHRVHQAAIEAYAHQDVPFEMLVDELQPNRDLSHAPLFQAMFVLQENFMNQVKLPGLQLAPYDVDTHTAKFDLTLVMWEAEGQFQGFFEYNLDLFESSTIDRLAGHLITLLQSAISHPEQPITKLALLTEVEQHQLLVDWNRTEVNLPSFRCIPEMFEAQAARTPDAVALVCAGQSLTYRELNKRANQLARYLRKLNVAAEVPVGICVPRSFDMIIGMLGILKAGGAYLPLDA